MKLKLIYVFIIFLIGSISYAGAIIERPHYNNKSAIQSSNITNLSNDSAYADRETLLQAIKEVQAKIKKSPENFMLNISLVNLYIKTEQYEKSFSELLYLNNLNKRNKLNQQAKNEINLIYENLRKSLNYSKNKSYLYVNLAAMALIAGENDKAEKYVTAAANGKISSEFLNFALVKIFDETQNYENAIIACDKILAIKPSDSQLRKIKADYLLQMNNTENAMNEYFLIVKTNPDDIESKYKLYKILLTQNISDKDLIKKLYPDLNTEDALSDLANVLLQNNEISDAKKYTQILVNKYPNNVQGYIFLAEINRKEGKLQESYNALNKIRDKANTNEEIAQYNVLLAKLSDEPLEEANSLMANGLYSQALSVLQSANQENLYVILAQARAYYFIGQKQKSLEYLNKAMSFYPNNSDVLCAFGYIYHKENDLTSARKYTNQALKINPENKTAKDLLKIINKSEADKYVNNIISAFEAQNYKETMRLINEAIQISPDYALLYYYKGLTYIAQNNYAASTASLYKSLELDKNNVTAYFYLAIAFDNLSEKKNALMYYTKFINLLPKDELGESEKVQFAKDRIEKLKPSY